MADIIEAKPVSFVSVINVIVPLNFIFQIIIYATPFWSYNGNYIRSEYHGLWWICFVKWRTVTCFQFEDDYYNNVPPVLAWFTGFRILMSFSLGFMFLATVGTIYVFCSTKSRLPKFLSGLCTLTGICTLISVILYTVKIPIKTFHFCYSLAIVSFIFSFVSAGFALT